MTTNWQQKKIGSDLATAAEELANAKRIGRVGGPLAASLSETMIADARRKVSNLVDMADRYHINKLGARK